MNIKVTSLLTYQHRAELEELLFFHPHQRRFNRGIRQSVANYGTPRIIKRNSGLRISVSSLRDVQTLYATIQGSLSEELVGVVVYVRTPDEALAILHIAVKHGYAQSEPNGHYQIAFRLVAELCAISQKVKGIRCVRLAYTHGNVDLHRIHESFRSAV